MKIITVDFETYWSTDYSLSRLAPMEYVMGEPFEIISMAWKVDDGPAQCVMGEAHVRAVIEDLRPDIGASMLLAHNMTGFDALILAYRLGVNPRLWGDTLAMARPAHAKTTGLSLAALVKHYGLGVKDATALTNTRGRRLAEFTADERAAMMRYNRADVEQCHALFHALRADPLVAVSAAELWHIDALVRMRTQPAFELDTELLQYTLEGERSRRDLMLAELASRLGIGGMGDIAENVRAELASAARFAALLQGLGADVPMKPSPTDPAKSIPALAKTDSAFLALQDSDDERVALAARARLDIKSTLLETRISKFLATARHCGGKLPVPLKYCGADTTGRDSGEDYNCQNLPRINPANPRPSDALRLSLRAGPGQRIIVADQSGIELRINHFLWRVQSSMDLYNASPDKADLYRAFASVYYNKPPAEVSKTERQFGKICQLGLGFGAGHLAFQRVARTMGGLVLTEQEASDAVCHWRASYCDILAGWHAADQALRHVAAGKQASIDPWGLVTTCAQGLRLPSGRLIHYPGLHEEDAGQWPDGRAKRTWVYASGRHRTLLHGPKVVENMVQALARDTVFDACLAFYKQTGLRPALRVHDELVYVVDEDRAGDLLAQLQAILRAPPPWWPELVVWSEGDSALCYGEAK